MAEQIFEGVSETGSLQEALFHAIEAAKENLKTDFVQWKLETLSGEDGGWRQVHVVKARSAPTLTPAPKRPTKCHPAPVPGSLF